MISSEELDSVALQHTIFANIVKTYSTLFGISRLGRRFFTFSFYIENRAIYAVEYTTKLLHC